MIELLSTGYASYTAEAFVESLAIAEVKLLVDSREIPLSRKPGFSKTKLSNLLADYGIEYAHFRELGSPSAARKSLHNGGSYPEFFSEVRSHLLNAKQTIETVKQLANEKRTCIMCLCPDVKRCHRSVVLDMILKLQKFKVTELQPNSIKKAA